MSSNQNNSKEQVQETEHFQQEKTETAQKPEKKKEKLKFKKEDMYSINYDF